MKSHKRTDLIVKQVEEWRRKNDSLSSSELTFAIIRAIEAVRKRTLLTLSNVTVSAVIDRTLFECKERFPVLAEISHDADGFHFDKFKSELLVSSQEDSQLALQEFLIELLEVFGKITANILTKYLIHELIVLPQEVKQNNPMAQSVSNLSSIKNREKK